VRLKLMETLKVIKATLVTKIAGGAASFTILSCYFIAVGLGHVQWWLPMISDCAVESPESYLFRFGLIPSALLLWLNSLLMLYYLSSSQIGGILWTDNVAFYFVTAACVGLGLVGSINEKENGSVHGASAIVFFVGYQIYMTAVTIRMKSLGQLISPISVIVKTVLASICGICLLSFFYLNTDFGYYHIQIAMCEWTGVFCIILYNLSFCFEYKQDMDLSAYIQPQMVQFIPLQYIPLVQS